MSWNAKFSTGSVIRANDSDILFDLFSACNERSDAVSLSALTIPVERDLLSLSAFQTRMTSLMQFKFMNQTLNFADLISGMGNGRWTEASILSYLGETRIDVPATRDLFDAWVMQQYRILNLLVWVRYEPTISNWQSKDSGTQTSWATAESVYLSNGLQGSASSVYMLEYEGSVTSTPLYRKRCVFRQISESLPRENIEADLYAFGNVSVVSYTFETGLGFTNQKNNLLQTFTISNPYTFQFDTTIADGNLTQPAGVTNWQSCVLLDARIILKYDTGSNKFDYL